MSSNSTWPKPEPEVCAEPVLELKAPGFPPAQHPSESELYCRQVAMPGHHQGRLGEARVTVVGAGGLGSWIAIGLARMGVSELTLVDFDRFDRTNAPRQFMFANDVGDWKAHALARNVLPHMTSSGKVIGIVGRLQSSQLTSAPSVVVMAVDNNQARTAGSRWCQMYQTPIVFAMLSRDGMRVQIACQHPGGPCLRCLLPNMADETMAPCAAAAVTSCMLAAAHTIAVVADLLMAARNTPTWRETSLDGSTERAANPRRRPRCSTCSLPRLP